MKYFRTISSNNVVKIFIYENCSSFSSETRKATIAVGGSLKEPPSDLKIMPQSGTYDMTDGQYIKNEFKIAIPSDYQSKYHNIMRRYNIHQCLALCLASRAASMMTSNFVCDTNF